MKKEKKPNLLTLSAQAIVRAYELEDPIQAKDGYMNFRVQVDVFIPSLVANQAELVDLMFVHAKRGNISNYTMQDSGKSIDIHLLTKNVVQIYKLVGRDPQYATGRTFHPGDLLYSSETRSILLASDNMRPLIDLSSKLALSGVVDAAFQLEVDTPMEWDDFKDLIDRDMDRKKLNDRIDRLNQLFREKTGYKQLLKRAKKQIYRVY